MQHTQMSRVHFEEDTPAFTEIFDVMESKKEEEMGMSSQCEEDEEEVIGKGNGKRRDIHFDEDASTSAETSQGIGISENLEEDVKMRMNFEVEEVEEVDMMEKMAGGKNKENKASSFSAFSNILAQRFSKDSTTEEIFCASRRGRAVTFDTTIG